MWGRDFLQMDGERANARTDTQMTILIITVTNFKTHLNLQNIQLSHCGLSQRSVDILSCVGLQSVVTRARSCLTRRSTDAYAVLHCSKQFAAQTLDVSTSRQGDNRVDITYAAVLRYREVTDTMCMSLSGTACGYMYMLTQHHYTTWQAMYVLCKRNIEARSRNHYSRGN
jgi:hypothetical protein